MVAPDGNGSATYVISAPGSDVVGGNPTRTDIPEPIIQVAAPDVTPAPAGFRILYTGTATATVIDRCEMMDTSETGLYVDGALGTETQASPAAAWTFRSAAAKSATRRSTGV